MGSLSSPKQQPLGVLVSSINIFRAPGDVNHPRTFDFPTVQAVAENSQLNRLVANGEYDEEFINNFVKAGLKLVDAGAIGIITSCGFLAKAQKKLANRLPVPVAASSLLQIPMIRSILRPGKSIGILTFDGDVLGDDVFHAINIHDTCDLHVKGVPREGHMRRYIRDGAPYIHDDLAAELIQAAKELLQEQPSISVILLECTQFPPFAVDLQKALKLPIYDVVTLARWFYWGLVSVPHSEWDEKDKLEALIGTPVEEMPSRVFSNGAKTL